MTKETLYLRGFTMVGASLMLFAGCGLEDNPSTPGQTEESSAALQNGTRVAYPFAGADLIARAVVNIGGCTATLLNDNWVITAKHCVAGENGLARTTIPPGQTQPYRVHHYPTGVDVDVPAANIYIHPDLTMDVALMHLPTSIKSGQGTISLFTGEDADVVGKQVKTYGFGPPDIISGGCLNGKACPAGGYFCTGSPDFNCVLNSNVANIGCTKNSDCPATYSFCDLSQSSPGLCIVPIKGSAGGLQKAIFTAKEVVRNDKVGSDIMNLGNPTYNGKYLTLPENALGQHFTGGDSGGPTFINGQLVGLTGGGHQVTYAKAYRRWVNGIVSPSTTNALSTTKTTFYYNMVTQLGAQRTGDVNNDGYVDLVQFNRDAGPQGSVYVVLGSATGFKTMTRWNTWFCVGNEEPGVGDVDGDGNADIITYRPNNGNIYVAISDGVSQFVGLGWVWASGVVSGTMRVGDVNGDGRADVVMFDPATKGVYAYLACGADPGHYPPGCSSSSAFGSAVVWNSSFASSATDTYLLGDVNSDSFADLVRVSSTGTVSVALTRPRACTVDADCQAAPGGGGCFTGLGICGTQLGGESAPTIVQWGSGFPTAAGQTPMLGDMNGDGFVDIVNFETVSGSHNGNVGVMLSTGKKFGTYTKWGAGFCRQGDVCAVGDVNHDGKSDVFDYIYTAADSYSLSR